MPPRLEKQLIAVIRPFVRGLSGTIEEEYNSRGVKHLKLYDSRKEYIDTLVLDRTMTVAKALFQLGQTIDDIFRAQ